MIQLVFVSSIFASYSQFQQNYLLNLYLWIIFIINKYFNNYLLRLNLRWNKLRVLSLLSSPKCFKRGQIKIKYKYSYLIFSFYISSQIYYNYLFYIINQYLLLYFKYITYLSWHLYKILFRLFTQLLF